MVVPVLYESWQLECCGPPFAVGDRVSWAAERSETPAGFEAVAGGLPDGTRGLLVEDHHDLAMTTIPVEGVVRRIRVVRQTYVWSDKHRAHVPSGEPVALVDVGHSSGMPHDSDVRGLIVDLDLG